MKRETFYAKGNRSGNLLHIETDGCIVNIRVGLTDPEGRQVTAISVIPDDSSRGGDGEGRVWLATGGDAGVRVVRQHEAPELTPAQREIAAARTDLRGECTCEFTVGDCGQSVTRREDTHCPLAEHHVVAFLREDPENLS